jgi:hypothetical protein
LYFKWPVFLYEISQPKDTNETRKLLFRKDLSDFLELKHPLDTDPPHESGNHDNIPEDAFEIDICKDKYKDIRATLMELAITSSRWIIDYFIDHPDVTVSSPDRFREVLESWKNDPCDDK